MWNGSFSDSEVVTTGFLLAQAATYLQPGVINLGHANHPAVLSCTGFHRRRSVTPTPVGGSSCAPRQPACSRSTSSTSTAR
jgi:hypothetical protein